MIRNKRDNKKNYRKEINSGNLRFNNETIVCNRCGGTGRLPQYKHVENGICFKCRGNRFVKRYYKWTPIFKK